MFDFLFNPNGRISRKGFVLGFLLPWIALTALLPAVLPKGGLFGALNGVISLFFLWPSFVAVPVRRLHDLGLSGWWQVVVPVLSFVGMVVIVASVIALYGGDAEAFSREAQSLTPEERNALFRRVLAEQPAALLGVVLLLVWIVEYLLFSFLPGQGGENRFGDDPLASGAGFAD